MLIKEIRRLAGIHGLAVPSQMRKKKEIIHHIQEVEGNRDCFSSGQSSSCDQVLCYWRHDCLNFDKRTQKMMPVGIQRSLSAL